MEGTEALGIGLGSAIFGAVNAQRNRDAQANQNYLDRQQQEKMFRWNRDAAREDWNAQNTYNDPINQMNRLRQAGLSPHLVYGKGADTTAQAIRSYNGDAPNQTAPQLDVSNLDNNLMSGFDIRLKQEQTDNVQADTALKIKEQQVKDAQIAASLANTARSKFDLEQADRVKEAVVESVMLGNEKTLMEIEKKSADIRYTLDQNERAKIQSSTNVTKTLQEITNLKLKAKQEQVQTQKTTEEIKQLKIQQQILSNDKIMKEAEARLAKDGMFKTDPFYYRALMETAFKIWEAFH